MAPKKLKPQELEELLHKTQQEVDAKQQQLDDKDRELAKLQEELASAKAEQEKQQEEQAKREEELQSQAEEAKQELQKELEQLRESQSDATATITKDLAEKEEQLKQLSEEHAKLSTELEEARGRLEEAERQLQTLQEEKAQAETELAEVKQTAAEQEATAKASAELKEQECAELQSRCDTQQSIIDDFRRDALTRSVFLDVTIGDCEFANAFRFFLVVTLKGRAEKRSTDVSEPSSRPMFKKADLLLPTDEQVASETLTISVYVSIPDPTLGPSEPTSRLLGVAEVALSQLQLPQGSSSSQRVSHKLNFTRPQGVSSEHATGALLQQTAEQQQDKLLTVGHATVTLQVKLLTESERGEITTAATPLPPSAPSLDKEIWIAKPFRPRLRALLHRVEGLPVPLGRSIARVTFRLLGANAKVIYESSSSDVPVQQSQAGSLAEAVFGQEVILSLDTPLDDLRIQLALEMVSAATDATARAPVTTSLLDLHWFAEVLEPLQQIHLYIRPSGPVPAQAESATDALGARPRLLLSLAREPAHQDLDTLAAAGSNGKRVPVEMRVSGVAQSRPLPLALQGAMLVVFADEGPEGSSAAAQHVPLDIYYYDRRTDLSSFLETCRRGKKGQKAAASSAGSKTPELCTVTPMTAKPSRTPSWGEFVLRALVPETSLSNISVHLYDMGDRASMDPDSPLGGTLIGFATLDAAALSQPDATANGGPLTRNFLLDLRLLQAPGVSAALEMECRVWPKGVGAYQQPAAASAGALVGNSSPQTGIGVTLPGVEREAHEYRLNHELSVQLAKEFNMRAAALKRAGEEIVALRRQLQILQNENERLKSQIADEEALTEEVGRRPPPAGLENLSSAELALKLQRALEKYRDEKAKSVEINRRFEEACRELQRLNGLKQALGELESTHMEQNKELQRLQDESRRIDTYRHLTKTQEKVIAKLEKSLEASLQEVHKAQRVQADIEHLKTENLRLREKCSRIVAGHRRDVAGPPGHGSTDLDALRRQLVQKDDEIARLETLVRDLRSRQPGQPPTPDLKQEQQRAQELEASQAELEQRCSAAESRVQALQKQLEETAKYYGGQIMDLKVEIAQKDARARQLEARLKPDGTDP